MTTADDLREQVRARYAETARAVLENAEDGCGCGSGACCADGESASSDFGGQLYAAGQLGELPSAAVLASLGCGNPTAVAELREGEVVLDLGSGGGIDVILSARRVGLWGFVAGGSLPLLVALAAAGPVLPFGVLLAGVAGFGAIGSLLSTTTLRIARRAEARLEAPDEAGGRLRP